MFLTIARGRLRRLRGFADAVRGAMRDRFPGIVDLSHQRRDLRDLLTTQMNLTCLAIEAGCSGLDLYIVVDPAVPARQAQDILAAETSRSHLESMFPALLVSPMVRSIRVLRGSPSAALAVASLAGSRVARWPSVLECLRGRRGDPVDHAIVNRFYGTHGYLPSLTAPRGYGEWTQALLRKHYRDCYIVAVHPAQGRLVSNPTTPQSGAPLDEWYAFFETAGRRYPDVHFFVLGDFAEPDRLLTIPNVSVVRATGLALAHELALVRAADFFMGTPSGFATMAAFCHVPYVITRADESFAARARIAVGSRHYPFASEDQYLVWRQEDSKLLLEYFERAYRGGRPRAGARWPVSVRSER